MKTPLFKNPVYLAIIHALAGIGIGNIVIALIK